jgi:hypothetical protein
MFAIPLQELFASPGFLVAYAEYREALTDLGLCNVREVDALCRAAREMGGSYATLLWNAIALAAWWLVFRKRPVLSDVGDIGSRFTFQL